MAGWNLKKGEITDYCVSEEKYWSLFNFVFSDGSRKRNTYKFGLVKSILDNLFNVAINQDGMIFFSYHQLFGKFAENYWNLVVKYDLRQMRKDGKSEYSKVENIIKSAVSNNIIIGYFEFDDLDINTKESIIKQVVTECKKCVVGALYEDFEGTLYGFDLKDEGLYVAPLAYDFLLKYKTEIENLNYYSWAKFLEKINSDNAVVRILDKLELATPRRSNLSIYREILRKEFEECNCFYCGRHLQRSAHVDHFIPWSFVKDDKIWNFVLSCPACNERKNNKVPSKNYLMKIEKRNSIMMLSSDILIHTDFIGYSEGLLDRMWKYAKLSGLKEFSV